MTNTFLLPLNEIENYTALAYLEKVQVNIHKYKIFCININKGININ